MFRGNPTGSPPYYVFAYGCADYYAHQNEVRAPGAFASAYAERRGLGNSHDFSVTYAEQRALGHPHENSYAHAEGGRVPDAFHVGLAGSIAAGRSHEHAYYYAQGVVKGVSPVRRTITPKRASNSEGRHPGTHTTMPWRFLKE